MSSNPPLFPTSPSQLGAPDKSITGASLIAQAIRDLGDISIFTADDIGLILYPRTAAEIAAGVTPTYYYYLGGSSEAYARRYGAVLDGTTNDSAALDAAITLATSGLYSLIIDGPMAISANKTIPRGLTIRFVGTGALKPSIGVTITYNGAVSASLTNIFQGAGTVAFSASGVQSVFYPEWWGAVGDSATNDYAALFASATQASNAQGSLVITSGYRFDTSFVMPPNVELVGYGKNFGSTLKPHNCKITWDGTSFRSALRRLTVDCSDTTSPTVLDITGNAYNTTFEDVFCYNFNTQAANVTAISAVSVLDLNLIRVTVYGVGAGGTDGILLGNGCRAKVYSPDVELAFRGIRVTGTAQVDIISPYCERQVGYGIYVERTGAGYLNVFGGDYENPNAGTDCIGLASGTDNVSIYGGNYTLNGGKGIECLGSTPLTNVNVYGVPATNITDTSGVLTVAAQSQTTREVALTYSSPIATDASTARLFVVTATNGTAFTMSNPTNGIKGQQCSWRIKNTSGGALGAVTWSANFHLAGAWTQPGNGNNRSITFEYDGTNWLELYRTAADVAN